MKKAILVIDDDRAILDLVSMLLDDTDCEGYTLTSTAHLLDAVRRLQPRAVLIDIVIRNCAPNGEATVRDGWHAAEVVREHAPHVPLIMFTASSAAAQEFGVTARGRLFDALLPKPFDVTQLNAVLEGLCEAVGD